MAKLLVVGIGASAGGLEALNPLLKNLQKTNRFVFIIAQHMHSEAHTELMTKLLTIESELPVHIAKDGITLKTDQVYLIPAGFDGYVKAGKLHLALPSKSSHTKPSINILFNSIAAEYGSNAIGIILSGAGSDGANGCLAIKMKGGLTIAQHPADANFDSMPREAISNGVVQHVMSSDKIGMFLGAYLQENRVTALQGRAPLLNLNEKQLADISQTIFRITGVDFTRYKPETIIRRINARIAYLGMQSVDEYLQHFMKHKDEIQTLQQALLVSNSQFFRDPASFKELEAIFAKLISQKNSTDTVHVFVPACASGEECYSLAIMFSELREHEQNPPSLKIVGRDLNAKAIVKAEEGWYLPTALKHVDGVLLNKYFTKERHGYRVNSQLREICRFELADVFNTDTAAHFDMISCRNFLIYLQPDLQNLILKNFYNLLNPHGLLFLGQAESISEYIGRYFLTLSHPHKIFQRK